MSDSERTYAEMKRFLALARKHGFSTTRVYPHALGPSDKIALLRKIDELL